MMAKRPILKMNNFDKGDKIKLKANDKETHYQGYAVYFEKQVTTVNARGVRKKLLKVRINQILSPLSLNIKLM